MERIPPPYLTDLSLLPKQLSERRRERVVLSEQPSLQAASPLPVLPPVIRLLPFLRLSLTRQKATWGMTGQPDWLTSAALGLAISFSCAQTCWRVINEWTSSPGSPVFFINVSTHCCRLRLGGAAMLLGQLLVRAVYCRIVITVLWLCFGNKQLMKMFGTTCHASPSREP